MSYLIDLPEANVHKIESLARMQNSTVSKLICEYFDREFAKLKECMITDALAELDALVKEGHGKLTEPYVFNRADAYPEGEFV